MAYDSDDSELLLEEDAKNRKKAIKDAVIYGLGIVVIYLVLGLSVTLIFGASMLNN